MQSGDGAVRRIHPIFATFVGDYPEQLLVACCKNNQCPKCSVDPNELGKDGLPPLRDLESIIEALNTLNSGPTAYAKACKVAGIKPIYQPFWADLPYVDIFCSITPDILHQLYQGIIKHLLSWLTQAFGANEIDARCKRLPRNHKLRHFSKGITTLSRVSGQEHSDMCRILLGLIVDLRLPNNRSPVRVVRAVRGLLDFLYIAQFPAQTTLTLATLQESLSKFHDNKQVFIDLGIRADFNIPKLHSLQHYVPSIELFGTTDNYNTENTERLHIDLAKDAYRATNHKDEYPQMTLWLERKEKVLRHELFIAWQLSGKTLPPTTPPELDLHTHIKMTQHPSARAVSIPKLVADYGTSDFRHEFTMFVANENFPGLTPAQLRNTARNVILPFYKLRVYHKVKFWTMDPQRRINAPETLDVAHVRPQQQKKNRNEWRAGRFDTVLVNMRKLGRFGIQRKLTLSCNSILLESDNGTRSHS
jgi:Plavaka transposase